MRELRPVMVVWDEHPLFVLETGRDDSSARQDGFWGLWAWAMGTRVQLSLSLDDALGSFQLASNEMYFPVLVFLSLFFSLFLSFFQIVTVCQIVQRIQTK